MCIDGFHLLDMIGLPGMTDASALLEMGADASSGSFDLEFFFGWISFLLDS